MRIPESEEARIRDYQARLGIVDWIVCAFTTSAAWVLVRCCRPNGGSTALACVATLASFVVVRGALLERLYRNTLIANPRLVSDADSRFHQFDGDVLTHYKLTRPRDASPIIRVCHAAHGFGGSTISWDAVRDAIAQRCQVAFVDHDCPGFGLTERPPRIRDYELSRNGERSVKLTSLIKAKLDVGSARTAFVGHSMGGISAAYAATHSDADAAALVLVAPAIFAPAAEEEAPKPRPRSLRGRLLVLRNKLMRLLPEWLAYGLISPFILFGLRKAVRARAFWRKGLASCLYDGGAKLTDVSIDAYRRPKVLKDWDVGMTKFTFAMARGRGWAGVGGGVANRLKEAAKNGLPIMIIHGAQDRIVPLANSERLAKFLRAAGGDGARVTVEPFEACGHLPMDEHPKRFVDAVAAFLSKCA